MRLIDADALTDAMYTETMLKDTDMQRWDSGCWIRYKLFENVLKEQPTIDAMPRWIPVSERLPEIDMHYPHSEPYLVVYDGGSMDVARWSNINWFWVDHVTEPYWCKAQYCEVIAWMPLPKPYQEEDHE